MVSAWQTGPLPALFGHQHLAGEVQGEFVARNLLMEMYTCGGNATEVCALSGTHTSAFMSINPEYHTRRGKRLLQDSVLSGMF